MAESTRKKIRTEASRVESENDDTVQQNCENSVDSNIYLTYDILRIIFGYLNGRDLTNAAMVCRLWLEAANNEKSIRRSPHCFKEYFIVKSLENYKRSTDDFNLKHLKNSRIKPFLGFFFISVTSTTISHLITEYILNLLPKNCETTILCTRSIVNEEQDYTSFPSNIICALLPQISNVKVNMFTICMPYIQKSISQKVAKQQSETFEYEKNKLFNMIDETSMPNNKSCLMLFCNYSGHATAEHMISAVQNSKGDKIASLWGGVVRNVYTQRIHNNEKFKKATKFCVYSSYCVAVLITGPIQSWSIVVDQKCDTKALVEKKLRLFKDQVKLRKHSVGFMFACIGRTIDAEKDIESIIFKTLFPNVPLVGCFGDGEFGKNTIPINEMKKTKKRSKGKNDSWCHQFSTIFMILTYD